MISMMFMLLMMSATAYGMDSAAKTRTRPRTYTDEFGVQDDMVDDVPTTQSRPRSLSEELAKDIETYGKELEEFEKEEKAREAHVQSSQEASAAQNIESKRSADSASQQNNPEPSPEKEKRKDPDAPRLSLQELQERDAFKKRFKAAFFKGQVGKYLDAHITEQCNAKGGGATNQDIDMAIEMFLIAYSDVAFFPIKEVQMSIQEDLRKCRGGKVGQFAYNFYNPTWQREIVLRYRQKLSAEQLVLMALERCYKNVESPQIRLVLSLIKDHLSHNGHEQGRLLLREAENAYRYGIYKFLHAVHMNPRRVFVALAAAAVILYGSYRYYHRDY